MDTAALYGILSQFRYGVVASLSTNGTPQSALVGIAVTPALEVIFDTVESSRKYANLIKRPTCSIVLGLGGEGRFGEQTVQLEGAAIQPTGAELERYRLTYFATWPDGPSRLQWQGIAYFVIQPRWIRFSDFGQSPPSIEEHIVAS